MAAVLIKEVSQRPGEVVDHAFNWATECFNIWAAGGEYAIGARVRPSETNGFEYQATAGGQASAKREPKWPKELAATIVDGSITWTCVSISTGGLRKSITASAWTPEDASLLITGEDFTATPGTQATVCKVEGTTDETLFDVVDHVTFDDGTELDAILRVTIQDEAD